VRSGENDYDYEQEQEQKQEQEEEAKFFVALVLSSPWADGARNRCLYFSTPPLSRQSIPDQEFLRWRASRQGHPNEI
jgi:hypothetical protein